jgi:hypothetical protein
VTLYDQLLAKFLISVVRDHPFQQLKEQLLIIADYLHTQDHPAARWLTWAMNNVAACTDHLSVDLMAGGCELTIHGVLDQDALPEIRRGLGVEWKGFGTYRVDEVEIRIMRINHMDSRKIVFTAYFQPAEYA